MSPEDDAGLNPEPTRLAREWQLVLATNVGRLGIGGWWPNEVKPCEPGSKPGGQVSFPTSQHAPAANAMDERCNG